MSSERSSTEVQSELYPARRDWIKSVIQPDITYVVVSFSLNHKGNFSIVSHQKSDFSSHVMEQPAIPLCIMPALE